MSVPVMFHLVLERLSWQVLPRVPEPELVMLNPAQNTAFMKAGAENGVLAFLYFYHALQITAIVQPGDRVLDLACGPANQLSQIARLNPEAHFLGLDASDNMLDRARTTLDRVGVNNVELVSGDMTRLVGIADASMDCVICTMSLHHLPDVAALSTTMCEARRVLKRGGRLYFVDFGRLKRVSTQRFFADDLRQSAEFTLDYFHSLRAAFSVDELSSAVAVFGPDVTRYVTPLAPFTVVFKSAANHKFDSETQQRVQELYEHMSNAQQRNFQSFASWLHAGGYGLPCALT